ncbi:hypothetical protein [Prevotella sp. HCN-7019]|uniref:hypothetical protein n=1 Tax=Prevotella sp. HCN-7019 TaxID=3134668 RepID=UPI0030BD7779
MLLKDLFTDIKRIELHINAAPRSEFSIPYEKIINIFPDDELQLILPCPNGSCTKSVIIFYDYELKNAIEHTINGSGTFSLDKYCDGWEDGERINKFHCNSYIIIKGTIIYK